MGMFDYIRCKYPLPVAKSQDLEFQTKDTDAQYLDRYEIRDDGTLWHEDYDIVDTSDPTKTGWERFVGVRTRVNERWEKCFMTGEVRFYGYTEPGFNGEWFEFSAYFIDGKLQSVTQIIDEPAEVAK